MVTVRIWPAVRGKSIGSEKTTAPLGTMKDGEPEKVTVCRVEGRMAGVPRVLLKGRATVTEVMGRSETPKALENWSRILEAFWVE
jgi:hypothetical protein